MAMDALRSRILTKKIINDLKEKHHVPRQCRGFFYPFIYIEYISGTIDKIYESSQNNIIHLNDGRYVKWEIRKYWYQVSEVIEDRRLNPKRDHIPIDLFDKGIDKILKKVGEEATETIIAAKNRG